MRPTLDLAVVIGVIWVMVSGVTVILMLVVDGGVPEFAAISIFFDVGAAVVWVGLVGIVPPVREPARQKVS